MLGGRGTRTEIEEQAWMQDNQPLLQRCMAGELTPIKFALNLWLAGTFGPTCLPIQTRENPGRH